MKMLFYALVICMSILNGITLAQFDPVLNSYLNKYGPLPDWKTAIFTNFLTAKDYVVRRRPGLDINLLTNVSTTVKLLSLSDLNDELNDYQVSMELAQTWFNPTWKYIGARPEEFIDFDAPTLYGLVWTPGTYFVNEVLRFSSDSFRWKQPSAKHAVTRPNYRLRLYPDGTVIFVQRLTLRLTCQLDLRHYPLDRQICPMQISSFPHTTEEVVFHWSPDSVLFNPKDLNFVEYEIVQIDKEPCHVRVSSALDDFTCLQANFHIRRRLGSYMLQFYVPSIFFVSLSWLTFWVDIDAVVARIAFAIFLVVNMAAQMLFVLKRLPPVAYVKAIDVWMVSCLLFISASLIEYAYIKVHMRNTAVKTGRRMSSFFPKVSSSEEEPSDTDSGEILEVPAITRQASEDSMEGSTGGSTELPAVTSRPSARSSVASSELFSGSGSSSDVFDSTVVHRSGRLSSMSATKDTRTKPPRQTRFAPGTSSPAPTAQPRRQSLKLPQNPTYLQRVEFRIRKKLRQLKTNKALLIDVVSRIAFPLAFVLFNVGYWSYYLSYY